MSNGRANIVPKKARSFLSMRPEEVSGDAVPCVMFPFPALVPDPDPSLHFSVCSFVDSLIVISSFCFCMSVIMPRSQAFSSTRDLTFCLSFAAFGASRQYSPFVADMLHAGVKYGSCGGSAGMSG